MDHANPQYYERRTQVLLRRLAEVGPFVAASLVLTRRRCGKPGCRCASGEGHPAWRLTWKERGQKTGSVYVPVDLVEEVRGWVENHRRLKRLASAISEAQLARVRLYARDKRRRRSSA